VIDSDVPPRGFMQEFLGFQRDPGIGDCQLAAVARHQSGGGGRAVKIFRNPA